MLLLSINFLNSQILSKEKKEIDSLIVIANQFHMEVKTQDLLSLSKVILSKSEKIKYEKGSVYGCYYAASCFSFLRKFTESNKFLKKAQQYKSFLALDHRQNFRITGLLADNYRDLELFQLSIASYHESLNIIKKIKKRTVIDSLSTATNYDNLSILYSLMNLDDSTYYYLNKDKAILKNITFEDAYIEKSSCFIGLGKYHLKLRNMDSAAYYFDKSLTLLKGKDHPFEVDVLNGKAQIYSLQKNTEEALSNYFKALEKARELDLKQLEVSIYKSIANLYYEQGQFKKANDYQNKYIKLNDQLNTKTVDERNFVVDEVLKEEKRKFEIIRGDNLLKMYVFAFIIVIALITGFYFFRNYQRKHKEISAESNKLLNEKESLISKKEEETQVLKLQVNESFEEIVQLAKDNSPEFFSRFQEVYPDFTNSVIAVNEKMRLSELTLCAYIFLGFNTKDISAYTFRSVHTIRSRKYNLRKKFKLSPEENMELWLKKLPQNPKL